jgi:RNA polymerase sigma factor (sigma-70 family)
MAEKILLEQLYKTEYRKIISVLCKLFGINHLEIAEDITNDTFLLASQVWRVNPLPKNPTSWLYAVAKNKTIDYLRRKKIEVEKINHVKNQRQNELQEIELDLSSKNITDSQLQMIFAICNPVISYEAQVGLALRILCGFGIDEIAEAFFTNKETINKRLFRAKEKLRIENIKIDLPNDDEINNRIETVLITLYLLFNEGYHSSTQKHAMRKELCIEAMRLTYFLVENNATNTPKVNALLSLMCFHSSRFEARTNNLGHAILYEDQNKELWNGALIDKGNYYLIQSAKGNEISKYHLEASIAYWHSSKIDHINKWENILSLYNQLLLLDYSPHTALNRTYALSKVYGNKKALDEALKLNLDKNHFYHTLLGSLYININTNQAILHFEKALNLVKNDSDKLIIENHLKMLKT